MSLMTRIAAPGDHVLIVGGGFSGTLLAINLLRHEGPRATLIERRPSQVARGVAYSAAHPSHLLNVRAGNMSALPDEPDHFVRWLEARGEGGRTTFVPRVAYGAYLREMLDAARAAAPGRTWLVEGEAVDLRDTGDGVRLDLADGRTLSRCDGCAAEYATPRATWPPRRSTIVARGPSWRSRLMASSVPEKPAPTIRTWSPGLAMRRWTFTAARPSRPRGAPARSVRRPRPSPPPSARHAR